MCPELTRDHIPRARDVGHFLCVTGTVIRTGTPKLLEFQRDYMCAKCRYVFAAQADFEQHYALAAPTHCPSPDGCTSVKFTCLQGDTAVPSSCRDYQEIKIQEQVFLLLFIYNNMVTWFIGFHLGCSQKVLTFS